MLFHDKNRLANLIHGGITMKNHTRINKLLTVLFCCAFYLCAWQGTAMAEGDVASVTINGETTYYTSIKDAVAKANESGYATITLLARYHH